MTSTRHIDQTDEICDLADKILPAMEQSPLGTWFTPSQIGRKAHLDTTDVYKALGWLAQEHYIVTSGNGAWTKYALRMSPI